MKKSFWGYNVNEVDESMEELEAARLRLERQVKTLNAELEKVQAELVTEREKAFSDEDNKKKEELEQQLRNAMKDASALRRENTQLTQKNEALSAQIAAYDEESLKGGIEQASIICRSAYEDMANAKANTKSAIEAFVAMFWEKFDKYEQKIRDVYEEAIRRNEETKENFLIAADEILTNYSAITDTDNGIKQHMDEIGTMRADAQKEIEALLGELVEGERSSQGVVTETPSEEELGEKYQYSILREISKIREEVAERQSENVKQEAEKNPALAQIHNLPFTADKEEKAEKTDALETEDSSNKKFFVDVSLDVDKKNII